MALELIKQKTFTDCGVAAIAMLLEVSYEDVWSKLTDELRANILSRGMADEDFRACLECLGLVNDKDFTKRVYLPYWGSVRASLNLLWGRRAIVSAWSKNEEDSGHFIVFDGTEGEEKVLDPSTRQTYDDWRDVEPKVMWLFSENAINKARLPKMVTRFLGWRIPEGFSPDCFVTFYRDRAQKSVSWPIGTNIFNADETKQMISHVLELK